jgi:nitroreductase
MTDLTAEISPELFARLAHPTVRLSGTIDEAAAASFLSQVLPVLEVPGSIVVELFSSGGDAEMGRRLAQEVRLLRQAHGRDMWFLGKTLVASAAVTIMASFPDIDNGLRVEDERMRRLKPDPVLNELIRKILEAGVCAPSGGNMQRWRFLVVRDPQIKLTVGAYYKRAWDEQVAPRYRAGEPAPGMSRERFLRLLDAAEYLAAHIHEAPVWIVPCLEGGTPTRTSGSSIYPAVQNMLLAARALGLGATLTTLYLSFEKEAEAALGLPAGVHSYALLPIGYPMGRFGPVRRIALADVVYEDRWGQRYRDPYRAAYRSLSLHHTTRALRKPPSQTGPAELGPSDRQTAGVASK